MGNEVVQLRASDGITVVGNAALPDPWTDESALQEPPFVRWQGRLFQFARQTIPLDGRRGAIYAEVQNVGVDPNMVVDVVDAPFF